MSAIVAAAALAFLVAAAPRSAAAQFPEGVYIGLDGQDNHAVSRLAGVEIHLIGGRYEMRRDGELRVAGRYVVDGEQLSLTDERGTWACVAPTTATAVYRWRRSADSLFLTLLGEDACNRRRNRLASTALIKGHAPVFPDVAPTPAPLRDRWTNFWRSSGAPGWLEDMFAPDAITEDGNRRLEGIDEIRQWLGGQDSRALQALPFDFSHSGDLIIEKGRYRDVFAAQDGTLRVLVGRYQLTWRLEGSKWMVQEWILR